MIRDQKNQISTLAAGEALENLIKLNIIEEITGNERHLVYWCKKYLDILDGVLG